MLKITIPATEFYDNAKNEFFMSPKTTLSLEHSLVSISKWECMYCKTFFDKRPKPLSEFIDYIKCMTLNQSVDDLVYSCITKDHIKEIEEYIKLPMTARKKYKPEKSKGSGYVTSEDIYFNMIMYNIPFECQKWHFNRLLALIDYCRIHNPSDNRKMSPKQQNDMYRELNAARRAAMHSKG